MSEQTTIVCPRCRGDEEKKVDCSVCHGDGLVDVTYWMTTSPYNSKRVAPKSTRYVLLLLVILACFVSGFSIFFWEIFKVVGVIK